MWGKAEVRVAPGALALERALLTELCAELDAAAGDPARLARPLRVVVPSRSLRDHLSARLVAESGRPALGIRIQTLHALAREVLPDAPEPRAELLFPVLVERAARGEPLLGAPLQDLDDAFGGVVATVSDLLDAGLEPELTPAALEAAGPGGRAAALVRVALAVQAELRERRLARPGDLLSAAAARVASAGGAVPACRGLAIHGFADATGRALDLLDALVRYCGARVFLDAPPRAGAFGDRLRERLEGSAGNAARTLDAAQPEPVLEWLRAPGAQAECRAVAVRVRALLDGGAAPERIGIVARTLAPYTTALRSQLARLAVPFSGCGQPGPVLPEGRRLRGTAELLRRGAELPVDRWLDLGEGGRELSLALHTLGAGRLGDVAALDVASALGGDERLALPVRRGIEIDDEGGPRARRRYLSAERLERAVARARSLLEALARGARERTPRAYLRGLRALRGPDLDGVVAELESALPPDAELSPAEFARVFAACVPGAAASAFGGEGSGVQVLDVTEARARCFEHLFVLGLDRDVFPRGIGEDPLLPDAERRALQAVLPDLQPKQLGHAEEAWLFGQLLSCSPRVTLSSQRVDDDGRPRAASPFVERLRLTARDVPTLWEPHADDEPRPALEHAALAGLHAGREEFGDALTHVLPGEAARARLAVLEELDPRRPTAELGPYFGLLGSRGVERGKATFVTRLEALARCPWQAFLRRVLRVEPVPDALAELPRVDPLILGNFVHRALERLADDAERVAWPDAERLDALLDATAREVMREAGIGYAAFRLLLVARGRPHVESARVRLWRGAETLRVLGSEHEGSAALPSGRVLAYRADLIVEEDERPVLIDVKTGRTISDLKTAEKRAENLRDGVARGERLQAPVYQRGGGSGAVGRYVFLDPAIEEEHAVFSIGPGDPLVELATATCEQLLDAWDAGVFFPRLVDARGAEPDACQYCEVAEACLRGDSGARARLGRALAADPPPQLRALFELGDRT